MAGGETNVGFRRGRIRQIRTKRGIAINATPTSTITHPATTTHGRISAEARATAGIGDGLLRIAVGLEDIDDLKADLARGLAG